MIVNFKRKEDLENSKFWTIEKHKYYSELSASFEPEHKFVVLCILIVKDEIIFLLGQQHGHTSVYLCSSDYFHVTDNRLAAHWVFHPNLTNFNMTYWGEKFESYGYFGFKAFSEVKNFLELAYDNNPDMLKIIQNEISSQMTVDT